MRPILGRSFQEGDDAAAVALTVVLGDDLWEDRYGATPRPFGGQRLVRGAGHGSGRKDAQVQWIADGLAFGWTMTE